MQQSLPSASTEFHVATSAAVKSLMEKKVIPLDTFVQTFLHTIITGTEHRDSQVADAWVDCLIEIIPLLPLSVLQKEVQPVTVQKSVHQRPVFVRISSCKIVGALCKKYPGLDVKRDLLPVVLSLCHDVNAEVRTAITQQLPFVVRPLGSEAAEKMLLPTMVELATDVLPALKEAAFIAIVESIPYFTTDVIRTVILPLIKQFVVYAFKFDNTVMIAIAGTYGKMVTGIERAIQASDKELYLKYYAALVEKSDSKARSLNKSPSRSGGFAPGQGHRIPVDKALQCRKYCAYNYPAIAKFVYSDSNRTLLDILHAILIDLITDASWDVRKTIAHAMHEMLPVYGKYKYLLKSEVIRLLNDDLEDVLEGIVPNTSSILVELAQCGAFQREQRDMANSELQKALEHCELVLEGSHNWRLYATFIQQTEVLWYIFPSHIVFSKFMDMYFRRLFSRRILPIRLSLIRTILVNMRYSQKAVQRTEIRNRILELSTSNNFYDRMLYIRACDIILDVYSTSYFKEHFFFKTLQMTDDPVPNIRWGLCKLLPKLHSMVKLPGEKKLLTVVESAIQQCSTDKDNEVQLMMKKAKIEIESQSTNHFPNDQAKYDEEKKLASLNPKLISTFPLSIMSMFEPTIGGVPIIRKGSIVEEIDFNSNPGVSKSSSISSFGSSGSSGPKSRPGSAASRGGGAARTPRGRYNPEMQPGFSDKEFLVDAGITLPLGVLDKNSFSKISQCSSEDGIIDKSAGEQLTGKTEGDIGFEKMSLNESKLSPKKKQFKHSIPVRKKNNVSDQGGAKKTEDIVKRHSLQLGNSGKRRSLQVLGTERKDNFQVGETERSQSLQDIGSESSHSAELMLSDKMKNLEVMDTDKRYKIEVVDTGQSQENVDINKNLTQSPDISHSPNIIQRRKKSQLPRPLSCVVLPVRSNGLDKGNSTSKLPVMRRT